MRNLYFFTSSYPYDSDVLWKTDELKAFKDLFNVTVIPYYSNNKKVKANLYNSITYQEPIFDSLKPPKVFIQLIVLIFSKYWVLFLKEFFHNRVFTKKLKFTQWTFASFKMLKLSRNRRLVKIIDSIQKDDILYFFWGRETSEILPILRLNRKPKIVVRFHGYDLYEERNNGYIPYRRYQLEKLDYAFFVSLQGMNYLKRRYRNVCFESKLFRLGTIDEGLSFESQDKTLRIVSCSSIIPLKRVHMIAKAVMCLSVDIEWTHIGGGDGFEELKMVTKNLPSNLKINLIGQVNSKDVKKYYTNKPVDLFINVSETEGVPVSIMEALSAGIPVIATNVGGTKEIIDNSVGKLISPDIEYVNLVDEISNFYYLDKNEKKLLRRNARKRYETMCNSDELAKELATFLVSL